MKHAQIAGALFDFMGWLTSREQRITLSSSDLAGPAVEAIVEFAKMRGLDLDEADVIGWHKEPEIPKHEAQRRELPAYMRSVPGVVEVNR